MDTQKEKSLSLKPRYYRSTAIVGVTLLVLLSLIWTNFSASAASGDVGFQDFSMSGASAPTGQKPQSKLWYNDGLWWGVLYNTSTSHFEIYKFNWAAQTWSTTGVTVDSRRRSSADALWTGTKLYVVSNMTPGASGVQNIYLVRFSYNSVNKTYSLDSGFPVSLWSRATETVVIDRDTTGMLWVTFTDTNTTGGRNAYVTHSTVNDATWVTPFIIPATGANNLSADDISTLVSFNGKIGVMWSNQNTSSVYFAIHVDGLPDNIWSQNPALQGPKYADDHLNIKSLQADSAGQVFAAVKTSLNDVNPSSSTLPEILLLTLDNNGSWSRRTVARIVDNHTRPIVLVDNENRNVYVFMTYQYPGQTSGVIYYKQASLDNASMQFPDGLGTPFMMFASSTHINNASSTKQVVNSSSNLLVIAGDDTTHLYFHNYLMLGSGGPTATATNTPTATQTFTPTPTGTPLPTSTFTPTPTSTPVNSPTPTQTSTPTNTPLPTNTPTPTATTLFTATPTNTPMPTDTPTATPTSGFTATPTNTPLPTDTPTPTPTSSQTTLFSDDFESGTFGSWTTVFTNGDGVAEVQTASAASGTYAAHLSETVNTNSTAYARRDLGVNAMSLTVSGDFKISTEGAAGGNVPLLRLFDASGVRQINIYRVNKSASQIYIQHSGKYNATTGILPLGVWSHFEARVTLNTNGQGVIVLYQDGTQIYQTTTASLGTAGIKIVQIGNETSKQAFEAFADNLLVIQ